MAGDETSQPLIPGVDEGTNKNNNNIGRMSHESDSSASTTSLVFERINERLEREPKSAQRARTSARNGRGDIDVNDLADLLDDEDPLKEEEGVGDDDLETARFLGNNGTGAGTSGSLSGGKPMDRGLRRVLLIFAGAVVAAWLVGLAVYVSTQAYRHPSQSDHDPQATATRGSGKKVTLDQVMSGFWAPQSHSIGWVAGPGGEDGLLLESGAEGKDFLVAEDVRSLHHPAPAGVAPSRTLMKSSVFWYGGRKLIARRTTPSGDFQRVLVATDVESNWRHSATAMYWIFDVRLQVGEPLVPDEPGARMLLAQWSPAGDAVVFTRADDNNMYLRRVGSDSDTNADANTVVPITTDGGAEVFNGVPDWVYEEEVFGGASATWWSADGSYIAFLRTNETGVPEYPVQYFVSRPSGDAPNEGEESYPEVRQIKYPKAGAHNPVVELKFYDTVRGDVFSVDSSDASGFADDDRLITTVVWAGGSRVLVKETNRVSDVLHVVLVDAAARTAKTVRTTDVKSIDGGWFEISQNTRYIPADSANGRPQDGYIDPVIYDDGDHLAYFTPVDSPEPIMLTSGTNWEVVDAPYAVDLDNNLVYFVATKESSPIQQHIYSTKLLTTAGQEQVITPVTDITADGYYSMSFSSGAGYGLLTYQGPGIPWQKVISTPGSGSNSAAPAFSHTLEENKELADRAKKHELPIMVYGTVDAGDGVQLNYVERRPPHFDERKKYPVLFYQYSGPGSQTVNKRFGVDFQAFVAAGLGYVCVTVDGRGTGRTGRQNRVLVRGQLGEWESRDQIAAAKAWAAKSYVDAARLAIWGWSYGGFMTLKTLERDAGATFSYGMAVAPVTDWRFYDSVYTERYMLTPEENEDGYAASAVTNATALGESVRFLLMHGVADDNVHFQNSLTLLDKLDLAGVENYDVHVFPDSDHAIYFHNANRIVYDKLTNWLVNAFNGEWLKIDSPKPVGTKQRRAQSGDLGSY